MKYKEYYIIRLSSTSIDVYYTAYRGQEMTKCELKRSFDTFMLPLGKTHLVLSNALALFQLDEDCPIYYLLDGRSVSDYSGELQPMTTTYLGIRKAFDYIRNFDKTTPIGIVVPHQHQYLIPKLQLLFYRHSQTIDFYQTDVENALLFHFDKKLIGQKGILIDEIQLYSHLSIKSITYSDDGNSMIEDTFIIKNPFWNVVTEYIRKTYGEIENETNHYFFQEMQVAIAIASAIRRKEKEVLSIINNIPIVIEINQQFLNKVYEETTKTLSSIIKDYEFLLVVNPIFSLEEIADKFEIPYYSCENACLFNGNSKQTPPLEDIEERSTFSLGIKVFDHHKKSPNIDWLFELNQLLPISTHRTLYPTLNNEKVQLDFVKRTTNSDELEHILSIELEDISSLNPIQLRTDYLQNGSVTVAINEKQYIIKQPKHSIDTIKAIAEINQYTILNL